MFLNITFIQCHKSAFARVARAWTAEDQSIPSSIAARVVRRDGTQPEVQALHLDINFHEIDAIKSVNDPYYRLELYVSDKAL